MNTIQIPENLTGPALFKFLKENKTILLTQKKYGDMKKGDSVTLSNVFINSKGEVRKGNNPVTEDISSLNASSVINTTNWMDSHSDVHISGIWKKSLNDNKNLYLLQEHSMTFKGIISDEVTAFTKTMTWKDLGVDLPGETQALIFNSAITKNRNEFMFNEYRLGRVKNHSVGMRYVKLEMAINDEGKYYIEEKEVWDKYIDMIANKEQAEEQGYFWAVTEAKVIEGSAVPIGSNVNTPTLDNNMKSDTVNQPLQGTGIQPLKNSVVICPHCAKTQEVPDEGVINCSNCGQFVSRTSVSLELDSMTLINAIQGKIFIHN